MIKMITIPITWEMSSQHLHMLRAEGKLDSVRAAQNTEHEAALREMDDLLNQGWLVWADCTAQTTHGVRWFLLLRKTRPSISALPDVEEYYEK